MSRAATLAAEFEALYDQIDEAIGQGDAEAIEALVTTRATVLERWQENARDGLEVSPQVRSRILRREAAMLERLEELHGAIADELIGVRRVGQAHARYEHVRAG